MYTLEHLNIIKLALIGRHCIYSMSGVVMYSYLEVGSVIPLNSSTVVLMHHAFTVEVP